MRIRAYAARADCRKWHTGVRAGVFAALALPFSGCSLEKVNVDERPLTPVVITDLDGREWNVTSAVYGYDMQRSGFQFGLGAFATPPFIIPTMVTFGETGFPAVNDTFRVIGVVVDGVASAYAIDDMQGREVANDAPGGRAVAVVLQPIEGVANAYIRTGDGLALTLSASGWLYEGRSVLFDYESGSMWYRFDGDADINCIAGQRFGDVLEAVPAVIAPWNVWFAQHPTTRALLPPQLPPPGS